MPGKDGVVQIEVVDGHVRELMSALAGLREGVADRLVLTNKALIDLADKTPVDGLEHVALATIRELLGAADEELGSAAGLLNAAHSLVFSLLQQTKKGTA